MGIIEGFIVRYRREYNCYDQAARLVARAPDPDLQAAGIRGIVTSRANTKRRFVR
jgi:hypothetical protein